ncbi:hypothetical protein CRUP_007558 [Coryphaenoides rupestris]|nr:hypothetical protein CRUP_007558 [Coryphaenoides rupestris]
MEQEGEDTQAARILKLNDGNRMPILGLGTWKGAVAAAISAGYRHIDTAYYYQNEADVGRAIRSMIRQGVIRREDMFITTKLDYVDLYLVHFPVGLKKVGDEFLPMKDGEMLTTDIDYLDVWRGMEALQSCGKAKSIGVSNFNILQLERLVALARVTPAVNQVELHPYLAQTEMVEFCKAKNIVLTAYSPFGSPARPPELHRGEKDPEKILEDPVIEGIAKKHNHSSAQVSAAAATTCSGV